MLFLILTLTLLSIPVAHAHTGAGVLARGLLRAVEEAGHRSSLGSPRGGGSQPALVDP